MEAPLPIVNNLVSYSVDTRMQPSGDILPRLCIAVLCSILSPPGHVHGTPSSADGPAFCLSFGPLDQDRAGLLRAKPLADLNVGDSRTVRMIYFLPNDRKAQPDEDATFDTLMSNVHRNSVSDLSPLAGLTSLKSVGLLGNPVLDKSPLYGLLQRNPFLEVDIDMRTLGMISGDGQEGAAGAALDEPFAVIVLDRYRAPLAGTEVTFAVTGGGGSLSATTAITDDEGRASTTLTMGSEPGTNTIEATLAGMESVTFSALGVAVPRTLTKLSGDKQQGLPTAELTEPFVVSVLDQNGNPLPWPAASTCTAFRRPRLCRRGN